LYYVITKQGVIKASSIKKINNQIKGLTEKLEYTSAGKDFVCNVDNKDIEFLQDKKRLSKIAMDNLYKTDNAIKYILIAMFIMNFIILIRG